MGAAALSCLEDLFFLECGCISSPTKRCSHFSDKQVLSSLQLQMSLYFNMWFFPLWWISESVMLHLKVRQHRTQKVSRQ